MRVRLALIASLALVMLPACLQQSPRTQLDPSTATTSTSTRKTIVVAALNQIKFGDWSEGGTGGGLSLSEIHSSGLVSNDLQGNEEGRLAATLPSLQDGSIVILPDGRMQTTWRLRPNIAWHDGAPFTSDDLVFTWRAYARKDIPLSLSREISQLELVESVDPLTARFTYSSVYFKPTYLGLREFWPLPKHLLADALEGDAQAFVNLPYWSSAYVHLGPFRLTDHRAGEELAFERFSSFYLGQPKVDSVVVRTIADPSVMLASLKAGAIDIAPESTLPPNMVVELRDDWRQSGGGAVYQRPGTLRLFLVQMNAEWAQPVELGRDVRLRQGLLIALDREAMADALLPGFPGTVNYSFLRSDEPRAAVVGNPFARYRYDPARATQELAQAGWVRDRDGRVVNQAGEQIQLNVRAGPTDVLEMQTAAANWRELGLGVTEEITPPALARDAEYRAKFSALDTAGRPAGDILPPYFDSRLRPSPENRYAGLNSGGYANPIFDRLNDRLAGAIDQREQAAVLKEMNEVLATDLPAIPTYTNVWLIAVAAGVRAGTDFASATSPGFMSRNSYLWDRT